MLKKKKKKADNKNSMLNYLYLNRDNIIIVASSVSIVYYSIGAVKEIIELIEMSKMKYHESSINLSL
jgi:hypothetical protein